MTFRVPRSPRSGLRAQICVSQPEGNRLAVLLMAFVAALCLWALLVSPAWALDGSNVGIPLDPATATATNTPTTTPTSAAPASPAPATATPTTLTPAAGAGASPTATPSAPGGAGTGLVLPAAGDFSGLTKGLDFPQGTVQFMPEYDSQDVLVVIDYQLPAGVKLPLTFQFRVPKGARMSGYALLDKNGGFDYNRPTPKTIPGSGEWDIVEVVVPRNQPVHIEYYYNPGLTTTGKRDFSVAYEAPGTIGSLTVSVQQPARATGFTLTPNLPSQGQDGFGMPAWSSTTGAVKPGEQVRVQVAYDKPDANPSKAANGSQPGVSAETATNTNYLLWLLAAVVIGVGGFAAYRTLGSRSAAVPARASRPTKVQAPARPISQRVTESLSNSEQLFCTGCGRRFNDDDHFCSGCGEMREG